MTDIESIVDPEVAAFAREARSFLVRHSWCQQVLSGRKVWAAPGVLGVFQFTVVPTRPDVDADLWVIVGDLPPAYIAQPAESTWQEVLTGYVDEMRRWVRAVRTGGSLDDVIPVNVEPTQDHADLLQRRLDFIERELLGVPADSLENAG